LGISLETPKNWVEFSLGAMSNVAWTLFIVAVVLSILCALLLVFMLANDRDSEQPGLFKRLRSFAASFWFGIFLFVWAGFCWRIVLEADQRHTVIHPTYKSDWMSPQQGYAAASLLFLAACYSIFLSVRDRRNRAHNATRRT
jgi:peptidoglycan/LPS O-acetylase OafA/YrhL